MTNVENVVPTCPDCGSTTIVEENQEQQFQYGAGANPVVLSVVAPVFSCRNCSFEFTDYRSETARHDAVCRYLGVMTPKEVVNIRAGLGMSRTEFAELAGFGVASLQRWETGSLIQNAANDRLIYLMQFTANPQRLRRKAEDAQTDPKPPANAVSGLRTLPTLETLAEDLALVRSSTIFSEMLAEGAIFQPRQEPCLQ